MKKVIVSAPAVITLSDAGVEYGKPALYASITPRIYVTINQKSKIKNKNQGNSFVDKYASFKRFVNKFDKKYKVTSEVSVEIQSLLPLENVISSSIVALVGGLRLFHNLSWSPNEINEFAHELKSLLFEDTSGAFTSVATYGGLLWYRKEFDFLKTYWLLPFKLPAHFGKFVLIQLPVDHHSHSGKKLKARENGTFSETLLKKLVTAIRGENKKDFIVTLCKIASIQRDQGIISDTAYDVVKLVEQQGGCGWAIRDRRDNENKEWILLMHENMKSVTQVAANCGLISTPVTFEVEGIRKEQVVV